MAGVAGLDPTAQDIRQARDALLGLLSSNIDAGIAAALAIGVADLAITAEDQRQARDALLGLVPEQSSSLMAAFLLDAAAVLV